MQLELQTRQQQCSQLTDGGLADYGQEAAPFIKVYLDTMHASVVATGHYLKACCLNPPVGTHKSFLTPEALLTAAAAFKKAAAVVDSAAGPSRLSRIERASMAVTYVFLW